MDSCDFSCGIQKGERMNRKTGKPGVPYKGSVGKAIAISVATVVILCLFTVIFTWLRYSGKPAKPSGLQIPAYAGQPFVYINDNKPFFQPEDYTEVSFERYSELDELNRCGAAFANLSRELIPTDERDWIGEVRPSGWVQEKYEGIIPSDPPFLYNRCHLIAYCLSGENANEKNLITGTRYMNVEGMLPFEETVADYLDRHDTHVLYRVTPVFSGKNLVADGVLMEACSVEDHGEGIRFCVFCYNVQPGIVIDYSTGDSRKGATF